jgi:Tfp pilus assembly protein PilN
MSRTNVDSVESLTSTGRAPLPRVNLLPPEVHQARKLRRTQAGLGAGIAVLAVILGGAYLVQASAAGDAKNDLAKSTATTGSLEAKKAVYNDVPRTIQAIDAAQGAREQAMATDVLWYRYLNDLSYVTPAHTWLTELDVKSAGGDANTAALGTTGVASIQIKGLSKKHVDVAAWLNALAKESGFTQPYFTDAINTDLNGTTVVRFDSTVNVTADALSHRYDRKAG